MENLNEGGLITVISDAGVEADAVVVTLKQTKIRVNMQGVPMDFRKDTRGNWVANFSGMNFSIKR
ncbi:hypothetical protein N9E97_02230 [Planktomarina sp.]|jgi:hypothetical protein|nr:hypothetical protein [Planktomarina sp.]|tara:strand:+ start:507 stop:701 length:195 start_codon:yes stop_codon:yes gene_type:complete